MEVCAHIGGEAHLFLLDEPCDGEHADLHKKKHPHDHGSCPGHERHENSETDNAHHKPCEHKFISFDLEWPNYSTHNISIEVAQPHLAPSAGTLEADNTPYTFDLSNLPPRAPPWQSKPPYYFLATVRLLI